MRIIEEVLSLARREKNAVIAAIIYIGIMAVGMITQHFIFHYNYTDPNMAKVLIYFEIIMAIFTFIVYKRMKVTILSQKVRFTKWLIPFIIIILTSVIMLVTTGDFSSRTSLIFTIFIMTIFVGFSEELMFRGILLNVLLEKRTAKFAILFSSALFALLHSVNVLGGASLIATIIQLFATFLFGLVFSCLAVLMKNIIPLMIYHCLWDFSLLPQSITHANIGWISSIAILVELIVVIPLFIYTFKKFKHAK